MFFILSKVLSIFLSPFFWIMGGLIWAILTKKQVRRKRLLIAVFILSYVLGNGFLIEEVTRKWQAPVTRVEQLKGTYDIAIVLGGISSYDTVYQRIQFHQSSDRLWHALYLYKTGKVKRLLISGGSGSLLHKKDTEADRVYAFLLKLGIPKEDMLMEATSRNTRENAAASAKIINASIPEARCILVTSAMHMKRAMGCFSKVHLDVTPYTTDFSAGRRRWDPDKLLIPSAGVIDGWNGVLREIIGYYTYKVMGYI